MNKNLKAIMPELDQIAVKPTHIQQAVLVEILPTRIWIESGVLGERVVVLQHDGCEPFDYATFRYDYRYTSNGGTWGAAHSLALQLGATEPLEHRQRGFPPPPTAQDLAVQIAALQQMLYRMEGRT